VIIGIQYTVTPLFVTEHQWQVSGIETPVMYHQISKYWRRTTPLLQWLGEREHIAEQLYDITEKLEQELFLRFSTNVTYRTTTNTGEML